MYAARAREDRSIFLTHLIARYLDTEARILEIGCNAGRNLNHLFSSGFRNLKGIEINPKAVELMGDLYPEMARDAKIYNSPVEDVIRTIPDNRYDCVFTMAVLMYIHWDSDWIFPEIARITKDILVTIEREEASYDNGFARNYRDVFERLGMTQLEEINCEVVESFGGVFKARILKA